MRPERLKFSQIGSPDASATLFVSPPSSLCVQASLFLAVTRSFASKGASIPLPSRGGVGVGSLSFPGSPRLILFFCPTVKKEITERLARCLPQMKTELITLVSCLPHPCPSPHRGGEWLAPRYSSSFPQQATLLFSPARSLGVHARLFFPPAWSLGVQASLFFSPARSLGVQARLFFSPARSLGVQASLFLHSDDLA